VMVMTTATVTGWRSFCAGWGGAETPQKYIASNAVATAPRNARHVALTGHCMSLVGDVMIIGNGRAPTGRGIGDMPIMARRPDLSDLNLARSECDIVWRSVDRSCPEQEEKRSPSTPIGYPWRARSSEHGSGCSGTSRGRYRYSSSYDTSCYNSHVHNRNMSCNITHESELKNTERETKFAFPIHSHTSSLFWHFHDSMQIIGVTSTHR